MAQERSHAGIVLAPQQQYSVGQQLRGLLKLAADKSALEMANQLVFLPFLDGEKLLKTDDTTFRHTKTCDWSQI